MPPALCRRCTHLPCFSNRLLAMNYIDVGSDDKLFEVQREWGRRFMNHYVQYTTWDNPKDMERPLIVGYVSPDYFTHSVSYFIEAPLSHHDYANYKVVVYSAVVKADAKTLKFKDRVLKKGGLWRDIYGIDEKRVASMVRDDKVDILVELTGHTANNKLGMMACRPAPVQVTWIGYPNTTGLPTIDYRITDELTDPLNSNQKNVEELVRQLTKNEHLRKVVCQNAWGREVAIRLELSTKKLGWGRLARELTTLEAASWKKFTVGGRVEPSRCNFSACAVGNRLVLFGGEGINMQPMDDTFVLNLESTNPEWHRVKVTSSPPGRWGHTLSCLNGSWLVVFGGYGKQGLLNDVFVLDLDAKQPAWKEVFGEAPPLPRSWHSSCTVDGSKLVVSGGCTDAGVLLSDTYLLDLTREKPTWREIPSSWVPPPRLGHTLSVYDKTKILMFGGMAKSGTLRLRSCDTYSIDLEEDEPQWRQLGTNGFPGAGPPPRLDHVAVSLPCGRIIIFGGSVAGLHSPSQLFLLDPLEEEPTWRILNVPGQPPKFAWGHSTCVVGGTRVLVLGGHTGEEWILNELHELCLASRPDGDA